ncbi:hypothetical protein KUTeg_000419 [Tegillarca granosa]|uniref:CRAL-TRIO domain-containing protein n=1 Tax=Tegillarca granosa TaxID=220873 RepID=A0ABQ9FXJ2_TEGGR|nr:hypothetical protein KUTeg_000419 [Tegillarca granosa]
MKDISWTQVKHLTPYYAKLFSSIIQDAFPLRFKGLHYLHFHGQNFQELTEFIDEENLPEEYGGKQPPFSTKDWEETILKCDAEFDEEAKYGLLNFGAPASLNKEDAMEGTIGSFKKLNA